MTLPRIQIGRPQRLAALLLLAFFAQCLWVVGHQELSTTDYRFARCGREMWERPSPLAGYFTTCGNLNGDGTFAYRVAGFPLTAQRLALLAIDHFRAPANRLYAGGSLNGSTWEARHQLASVIYLIHLPFVLFALWLGGGLWWVARRLFGNEGGFFALGLYCFCPAIVRLAVTPNNDLLAMWGLYGLIYTAIGVAHAMQGPRRKWRPRIVLLIVALGLTAAAHSARRHPRLPRRAPLHALPRRTRPRLRHADPHLLRHRRAFHPLRVLRIPPRRLQLRLHWRRRALLVLAHSASQLRHQRSSTSRS